MSNLRGLTIEATVKTQVRRVQLTAVARAVAAMSAASYVEVRETQRFTWYVAQPESPWNPHSF